MLSIVKCSFISYITKKDLNMFSYHSTIYVQLNLKDTEI